MPDLLSFLLLLLLASGVLFFATARLTRNLRPHTRNLIALLTVLGGGLYIAFLWNHPRLTTLIPDGSVLILGNWFPLLAAVLAGVTWASQSGRSRARKAVLSSVIVSVAVWSAIHPMIGSLPECGNRWQGEVCLQTTPWTCSPACAATLLRAHGIDATEQEMVELCVTREGTSWLGLYRALALKTERTGWRVEVFETDEAALRQHSRPVILFARLPQDQSGSELGQHCGWIPGQGHSVVFLEYLSQSTLRIGDPAVGTELWRITDLDTLWTGRGIRLVRKNEPLIERVASTD